MRRPEPPFLRIPIRVLLRIDLSFWHFIPSLVHGHRSFGLDELSKLAGLAGVFDLARRPRECVGKRLVALLRGQAGGGCVAWHLEAGGGGRFGERGEIGHVGGAGKDALAAGLEDFECLVADVICVTAIKVVDADEETVVHDAELL